MSGSSFLLRARRMVHVSRPVLWINALGSGAVGMWLSGSLWRWEALPLLLWLTLPFNLLIYGVNDIFDQDTDAHSARKGSVEGARIRPEEVSTIVISVVALNAPFLVWFAFHVPGEALLWICAYTLVFLAYSMPPLRLKTRPWLDSVSNAAYAFPLVFVPLALDAEPVWAAAFGLMAWSVAKHAFDAVQDIEEDGMAGIRTTATRLGPRGVACWSGLWWIASTLCFAAVNLPVAAVNALIAGYLVVTLWRRATPAAAHRLYPLSIAFPYVAGSVAGSQLTLALFLGRYP